jgi:hypothetical protein
MKKTAEIRGVITKFHNLRNITKIQTASNQYFSVNSDLAPFAGALSAPANGAGLGSTSHRPNPLFEKGARFKLMF